MTDVPDSLDQMLAAWNETDPGEVRAHLDRALAPQVRFVDPSVDIVGVEAFEANIHHVHEQLPGATYSRTSEIDHHHNHHRYHWAIHSGGELFWPVSTSRRRTTKAKSSRSSDSSGRWSR